MPKVTGNYHSNTGQSKVQNLYMDVIICKWVSNGADHYDNITRASNDCTSIGYSFGSTGYTNKFRTTPTDDLSMVNKYIKSSACCR